MLWQFLQPGSYLHLKRSLLYYKQTYNRKISLWIQWSGNLDKTWRLRCSYSRQFKTDLNYCVFSKVLMQNVCFRLRLGLQGDQSSQARHVFWCQYKRGASTIDNWKKAPCHWPKFYPLCCLENAPGTGLILRPWPVASGHLGQGILLTLSSGKDWNPQ